MATDCIKYGEMRNMIEDRTIWLKERVIRTIAPDVLVKYAAELYALKVLVDKLESCNLDWAHLTDYTFEQAKDMIKHIEVEVEDWLSDVLWGLKNQSEVLCTQIVIGMREDYES